MSATTLQEVVASGKSKKYLGKNYTIEEIDEMGSEELEILNARYTSINMLSMQPRSKTLFALS